MYRAVNRRRFARAGTSGSGLGDVEVPRGTSTTRDPLLPLSPTSTLDLISSSPLRPIYDVKLGRELSHSILARRTPRTRMAASYAVRVPRAGTLPSASFRPRLAATPLLFSQEFRSPPPPEELSPSQSLPRSISLAGSRRRLLLTALRAPQKNHQPREEAGGSICKLA